MTDRNVGDELTMAEATYKNQKTGLWGYVGCTEAEETYSTQKQAYEAYLRS